ncbi:hypothetical protein BZA05DRAFT_471015 [Tricharina praecox]|uniref:uncharacterized protein n=1 Tax=Tricharina praecox TaxID=43433 RepID=UPI00221F1B71|nr:uncharacterized protein BZA05DRAFT_471015 [Tricharina praecox]KAI5856858.1 hypothetical protein BZA05DRAFT_471015 [Tricharina praecox]
MTPEQTLAFLITVQVLDVIICATRFILLRHHPRKTRDLLADFFFASAFVINFSLLCCLMLQSRDELRAITKFNGDMTKVATFMYRPYWTKITYIVGFFNIIELWCLKAAFLSFYWGLFNRTQTRLRYLLHLCIALVAASGIALLILQLTWCLPVENNWARDYQTYVQCAYLSSRFTLIFQSALNIGTDVMIFCLPLLVISRLMLEPNVRFALIVAFLLGGVSIAASGVRHAIINHILRDRSSALENYSRRKTVEMWGVIELSSALLAFCLPLFRRHLVSVFGPGGVLSRRGGNSGSSKQKVQVLAAATVGGSAMSEGRKGSKGRAGIEIEDVELAFTDNENSVLVVVRDKVRCIESGAAEQGNYASRAGDASSSSEFYYGLTY